MSQVKERNFSFRLLFRGLLDNELNEEVNIEDIQRAESGRIEELLASSNNDHTISDKRGKGFVQTEKISEEKADRDAKAKLKGKTKQVSEKQIGE